MKTKWSSPENWIIDTKLSPPLLPTKDVRRQRLRRQRLLEAVTIASDYQLTIKPHAPAGKFRRCHHHSHLAGVLLALIGRRVSTRAQSPLRTNAQAYRAHSRLNQVCFGQAAHQLCIPQAYSSLP